MKQPDPPNLTAITRREALQRGVTLARAGVALGLTAAVPTALTACADDEPRFSEPAPVNMQVGGPLEDAAAWMAGVAEAQMPAEVAARMNAGMAPLDLVRAAFLGIIRTSPQGALQHSELWLGAVPTLAQGDRRLTAGMVMLARDSVYGALRWLAANIPIVPLDNVQPGAGDASASLFSQGRSRLDYACAERAAIGVLRQGGEAATKALMFDAGVRAFDGLGHKQIAVAEYVAMIDAIGWTHAEAPIRALSRRLVNGDPSEDAGSLDDYPLNSTRKTPAIGARSARNVGDTLGLLAELRGLNSKDAATAVLDRWPTTEPETLWDALILHAAEAVPSGGRADDGLNVHKLTGCSAMRSMYRSTTDTELRLRILLQAAAYVGWFPTGGVDPLAFKLDELQPNGGKPADDPQAIVDALGDTDLAASRAAATAKGAADPKVQLAAAQMVMAMLDAKPNLADAYRRTLVANALRKSINAHAFKHKYTVFLEASRVSPTLRNRLLAVTAFYTCGSAAPDTPTYQRIAPALDSVKT